MTDNLEVKTSVVFYLVFDKNRVLLCFILLLCIIVLFFYSFFIFPDYCLIIFNNCKYLQMVDHVEKLAIPRGIPSKEEKEEIEIYPVTIETKIIKC